MANSILHGTAMKQKNKWFIILNPASGNGRALRDQSRIESLLLKRNISYDIFISNYPGHSIELTRMGILKGYRKFIAIGGDGTLNEITNGIFSQKIIPTMNFKLAAIPVGTGNDWAKNNGLENNYQSPIRMIADDVSYLHDVGVASFIGSKKNNQRFFLNFAGIGFDSAVVENMAMRKFGKLSYLIAILKTFLFYSGTSMEISIDGKMLKRNVFVMMAGLGKYAGGGMYLAPNSLPDDGFFDVTLVNSLGRLNLLFSLPKIYNGRILSHPRVEPFRCKKIKIHSSDRPRVEADGELLGYPPVTYDIIKKSLQVIGNFKRK